MSLLLPVNSFVSTSIKAMMGRSTAKKSRAIRKIAMRLFSTKISVFDQIFNYKVNIFPALP